MNVCDQMQKANCYIILVILSDSFHLTRSIIFHITHINITDEPNKMKRENILFYQHVFFQSLLSIENKKIKLKAEICRVDLTREAGRPT